MKVNLGRIVGDDSSEEGMKSVQRINYFCTNQDHSYYSTCSSSKFEIFRTHPQKSVYRNINKAKDENDRYKGLLVKFDLDIICMSFFGRSNVIGVVLRDDPKNFRLFELGMKEFKTYIKNPFPIIECRAHEQFIVLISINYVHVYDNMQRLTHLFKTYRNPRGICEINQDLDVILIAFPNVRQGAVEVYRGDRNILPEVSPNELYEKETNQVTENLEKLQNRRYVLDAFNRRKDDVECIGVDKHGTYLAAVVKSASLQGSGIILYQFNRRNSEFTIHRKLSRGQLRGEVLSLSFCLESQFLALSSRSGTLHIFSVRGKYENKKSNYYVGSAVGSISSMTSSVYSWFSKASEPAKGTESEPLENPEKIESSRGQKKKIWEYAMWDQKYDPSMIASFQWSKSRKRCLLIMNCEREEMMKLKMNKNYDQEKSGVPLFLTEHKWKV